MLRKRIIPCLQLIDESLVKAKKFKEYGYIGDPCNTVRIFNELEVDELCFLDIRASVEGRTPNYRILRDISDECFMPLSYGGGITKFDEAKEIFSIGFEKVIINTQAYLNPGLISSITGHYGSQAVIGSIDVKKIRDTYTVFIKDGTEKLKVSLADYVKKMEKYGVGEILITNMEREGSWEGYDLELVRYITSISNVPVIAHGGCGAVKDIRDVFETGGANAAAIGSMLVYQKKGMGVLVNMPERKEIDKLLF